MLTKLTEKQKKIKKETRDFWINTALHSGDEINRKEAKEGIKYIYSKAGLKEPKVIIVSSPLRVQIARNILNTKSKVENEVWNEVRNEVWNEVWNEVGNEVRNEVRNEVWNEVGNEVRNEVRNEVWNEVGNEVGNEVRNEVWNEVWNEVGNEVENEVWNEVGNEVRNEVENEVGKNKLKYYNFNYQNLTTIGWVSYYDFFNEIGIFKKETKEKFERYKKYLLSGVFFSAVFSDYAILSRRPMYCKKNEQGRLHSINSPVLEWRDGYKIYALNGIRFKKDLFEKLTSKKMSFQEILAIEDVDQRNQAMRFVGDEEKNKFLEHCKAEVIDTFEKISINGEKIYYKLYKIPAGEIFREDTYPIWYTCPSTGMSNFSAGDQSLRTVAEVMAWKMSDDICQISPENWKLLTPLRDEA